MTQEFFAPTDKATWGPGAWQDEPDRVEWRHAGLPCLATRSLVGGNWCGYVAVPPGHPLHGTHYDGPDVDVHGGLTYSGRCSGHICHVAQPGEPDDVWWFGFDCGHFLDVLPAMDARSRQYGLGTTRGTYKTLDYVQAETNQLAEQLARTES